MSTNLQLFLTAVKVAVKKKKKARQWKHVLRGSQVSQLWGQLSFRSVAPWTPRGPLAPARAAWRPLPREDAVINLQ